MLQPKLVRRYKERRYFGETNIKSLFDIPSNEYLSDVYYDKTLNELVVMTILDREEKLGDK